MNEKDINNSGTNANLDENDATASEMNETSLENTADKLEEAVSDSNNVPLTEDSDAETEADESGDSADMDNTAEQSTGSSTGTSCESSADEIEGGDEASDDDNDIAYVAERITGVRHSQVTTAAPIRTRTPEQNRNVTNGIPLRERKSETVNSPAESEKTRKLLSPFAITVATAIAAVVLMLTAVLIINRVYIDSGETSRPHDFDMADEVDLDSLIHVEAKLPEFTAGDPDNDTEGSSEADSSVPEVNPDKLKYSVTIDFFEGDDITVATEKITFGGLLDLIGYTLTATDRPSVESDFVIAADTVITVDKVAYVNVTVTEDIPYESERIDTDLIMRGTSNYITYGENGMKETVYSVEYVNGVEKNRTYVSEQVIKEPINEKYEYGVGGSFVGADGVTYTYSLRRVVPATYYNLEGLTYIGVDADESVIAVDPNFIPLYTMLYVKNDKYDFGKRIAADTGSLVKGWEIDIWIGDDNPQLADFAWIGYHYDMEIYYIDQ